MVICNSVYIVLLFTVITVFRTCGELNTVLPYYVPLYYKDIPLKLTVLPQLVLHAPLLYYANQSPYFAVFGRKIFHYKHI